MRNPIRRITLLVLALLVAVVLAAIALLYVQGSRSPERSGIYVAMGSSYAAGIGLGPRAAGSPIACFRSMNGYPQQLARLKGLALVDVTCSGAVTAQVLHGGQYFQGPQIDAIGPNAQLVTLTSGGNDVGYIGDITALSYERRGGLIGSITRLLWSGPKPLEARDFNGVQDALRAVVAQAKYRAPQAKIVIATYPTLLPRTGSCPMLGINEDDASLLRAVAQKLDEVTRAAAKQSGAILVDMASLSAGHDACAADPWVNGARPPEGAPFHPNLVGARQTARFILEALKVSP